MHSKEMTNPRISHLLLKFQHPRTQEVIRYLITGSAISLSAHLIYLIGLEFSQTPQISLVISFVFGTILGYFLHSGYVFKAEHASIHWITFPAAYLLRLLIGQAFLTFLIRQGVSAGWAGFSSTLLMAPLGYILLRLVLVRNRK